MKRLDGKALAEKRRQTLKDNLNETPNLAVVLVGNDPASQVYVRNKENACAKAGIAHATLRLPENTSQEELEQTVKRLNEDASVDGILVQLPLPKHLDEEAVIDLISPNKDVDGLTAANAGALMTGKPGLVPCTPLGVMALLEEAGYEDLSGKKALVIGRSNLVGKPVSILLLNKNATVTMAHSKSPDLKSLVKEADIVVAAAGAPALVKADWVKPGALLIDVGINRVDGRLAGDIEPDVAQAAWQTPVPGGCGPMTVQMLLENTVKAKHGI